MCVCFGYGMWSERVGESRGGGMCRIECWGYAIRDVAQREEDRRGPEIRVVWRRVGILLS